MGRLEKTMNWYRMTKEAGLPAVNLKTFLEKLEQLGVEFKREGKGDHAIYWHPPTGKQTPVPMGPGGRTINPLTLVKMLRNLGFSIQDFKALGEKAPADDPSKYNIDIPAPAEEEIPEWQKAPWYQEQLRIQQEQGMQTA